MQVLLDSLPVLLISVFAPLTAWFAAQRSRHPVVWFVFGALLGPIALALVALGPPGRCPYCATPVRGWVSTCSSCGLALGDVRERRVDPATGATLESDQPLAGKGGGSRSPRPRARPSRAVDRSTRRPSDTAVAEVLATGIYLTGSANLEIGACYALARLTLPDGDLLRVFGPVDTGQITVRHESLIDDLEVTVVNERVIISARPGRTMPTFVFKTLGGKRGLDLERAFEPIPVTPR